MEGWKELENNIDITDGYGILTFIDKFEVLEYPFNDEIKKELEEVWKKKLLDIRIFNSEKEYRVFRGDLKNEFIYCFTDDSFTKDYYDDEQYLDIDSTKKKKNGAVTATGGGKYKLPFSEKNEVKLHIRNYIDYDEKYGQAYIKRWRITDIREE